MQVQWLKMILKNALKYKQQMLIDFALVKESIAIKKRISKNRSQIKKSKSERN